MPKHRPGELLLVGLYTSPVGVQTTTWLNMNEMELCKQQMSWLANLANATGDFSLWLTKMKPKFFLLSFLEKRLHCSHATGQCCFDDVGRESTVVVMNVRSAVAK